MLEARNEQEDGKKRQNLKAGSSCGGNTRRFLNWDLLVLCWFYFFTKFLAENRQQHTRNEARSKQTAPLLHSCRIFLQLSPSGSEPGSALSAGSPPPYRAQPNLPPPSCQKGWSFMDLQLVLSLFSKPEIDPSSFSLSPRALQVVLNSMADVLLHRIAEQMCSVRRSCS